MIASASSAREVSAGAGAKLLLNGRFLTRPATGVDRTAQHLVRGLQQLAREGLADPFSLAVAVPAGAPPDAAIRSRLDLDESVAIIRSRWRGYVWEQVVLAFLRPRHCLLSLCNLGPVIRRSQLVLIHDAQVFDAPGSYSRVFRHAYRFILPNLARRARFLATVSRFSRERLRRNGVGAHREIEVLPNGIDHLAPVPEEPDVLQRLGLRPGGYLLAIGRPERHKNTPMLLRACAARRDRSLPLVLIRSNDMKAELAGLEGAQEVIFVGRVSDGELKALMRGARIFLFPSITEGFGLPALEAMACGCPVIASNGGAIPEVAGEAAAYCDPLDESDWTCRIEELAASTSELARLKAAGLARAATFQWSASAAQLLGILGLRVSRDALSADENHDAIEERPDLLTASG